MAGRNPPENPYLAARQEWNERYGSYVMAARVRGDDYGGRFNDNYDGR